MYRTQGFADELQKLAAGSQAASGLKGILFRAMRSRPAKAGLMLGTGGLVGGALGLSSGRKKGYEAGTGNVEQVAIEALQMGRQQGAQVGYQFAMDQMLGKQAAPNVGTGVARQRGMGNFSMRLPVAVNMPTERIVAGGGKRKPRGGSPVDTVTQEVRKHPSGASSGGFAMGKMNFGEGYDPLAKGRQAAVPQRQVPRAVAEFRGKTPSEAAPSVAAPSVAYDVRRGQAVPAGSGGRPKIDLKQSMNELLSRQQK